ncbi:hypothetical protein [Lelliottia wanjuensis]|uniref:hypothetical protein n=1 Tax=Lelliottia wanjuensis TaxID=3050585 RepID=UPI00254B1507|nr:hypothetical protein [Lelliottia sp. V86_10]MDK9583168.1 hypothetical protein [Lelliottia sp. V86_10]
MSLEDDLNKGYGNSSSASLEASLNAGYHQPTEEEPDHPGGLVGDLYRWATGEGRKTEATEQYHLVDAAPEFSGFTMGLTKGVEGLFHNPAANIAMALATTPEQKKKIIEEAFPGSQFWKDEKGNIGVDLPSGRYMLDKPGLTPVDAANALITGLELEITGALPAGAVTSMGGGLLARTGAKAVAGTAADLLNQGIVSAGGGGPISIKQVIASGALNALIPGGGGVAKSGSKAALEGAEGSVLTSAGQLRKTANLAARKGGPEAISELAALVDADPEILAAAGRLGISPEELLPSHYSNNEDMRRLIGLLASRQGSGLAEQESALLKKLAERVKQFITENGGSLDGGEVSAAFKKDLDDLRETLSQQEGELYKQLDTAISPVERIQATNTIDYLDKEATKRGGGLGQLEGEERKVSDYFEGKDGTPTYHGLDRWRKKIGRAYGKAEAARSPEEHQLAELYHVVRDDVKDVAERHGLGDVFDQAKEKGAARFALNDVARGLLGKDETEALMPKITAAVKKLSTGQIGDFVKVMNLLPAEYRQKALVTALGDMFSQGSKSADILHLPGAVNWLRDVKGNSQVWGELTKHLPEDTVNQLNDIFTLFGGVRRARQSLEANTGTKIGDFEKLINQAGGVQSFIAEHPALTKGIEQTARYAATAGGYLTHGPFGPVISMAANSALTSLLNKLKGNVVPELDRLLSTPEFSGFASAIDSAAGLEGKAQIEALRRARGMDGSVASTDAFREFYKKAPKAFKDLINRKGLAKAIFDEVMAEKSRQNLANPKKATSN